MMANIGESSSERPVIVRVKRKSNQSRLDAFWLEINERPVKRPHLDFHKLSLSDSPDVKAEELKTRKVLVQHVETVTSSEATIDVVQSFVTNSSSALEGKQKCEERKGTFKKNNQKQEALLTKARQNREASAKNARFEQIWRRRKGDKEGLGDKALYDICRFYDVLRVDETSKDVHEQEDMSLEDQRTLSSYLPLLREFIPGAAEEIESDLHSYMSKQGDYVFDYYTVKEDIGIGGEEASYPFPLVQVEDEDFYDGSDGESEYDSEDSNAEAHPRNDYPDEMTEEEDETRSETSTDHSDEEEEEEEEEESDGAESESVEVDGSRHHFSEDADLSNEDEYYDDDVDYDYNDDGDNSDYDDEDWR